MKQTIADCLQFKTILRTISSHLELNCLDLFMDELQGAKIWCETVWCASSVALPEFSNRFNSFNEEPFGIIEISVQYRNTEK